LQTGKSSTTPFSYLSDNDNAGVEGFSPIFSTAEAVDSLKIILHDPHQVRTTYTAPVIVKPPVSPDGFAHPGSGERTVDGQALPFPPVCLE
jgi:hypothetical protein